jgi:hypothetical protein
MTAWIWITYGLVCMIVGAGLLEMVKLTTRPHYLSATEAEKEECKRALRSMHQYDVKRPKL